MATIDNELMDLTKTLDLKAFWAENERCQAFTTDKPRCLASFSPSPDDHWAFEFMQVPSTLRYYQDKAYRDALHREINQLTMTYVGKSFFDEDTFQNNPKRIENLFGCEFTYHEGGTPWLTHVTDDPVEFAAVLDKAEGTDLATWSLPEAYLVEWEQRKQDGRPLPLLGRAGRGPATILTSILQPETCIYWCFDHPDLMRRFRDILAEKLVALNQILRDFSGNNEPGYMIYDDNSALFNVRLYREFCYPVLEKVFNDLAPGDATRYQHSDSSMGHLMDMQYELGIRSVNYGPDIDSGLIREKMPDALINGHLPPFLLRDGSPEAIRERIVADFEKAGGNGGLHVTTAGSLAAGTGVERMRLFMLLVQEHCRYDR